MINAGSMRHRVEVQQLRGDRTAAGDVSPVWETIATRWAAIEPLVGRELYEAQAQGRLARVPTRFRMRYLAELAPDMRLVGVMSRKIYDVKAVQDVENRHAELVILAEEQVGEAA